VLIDPEGSGYWSDWLEFLRKRLVVPGLIDHRDLHLLTHTSDTGAARDEIRGFYKNYHSSRYVGERLLIRLQSEPTTAEIEAWSREFSDIIVDGAISKAEMPPEEREDPLLADLHAISLRFTRKSFARLRDLIDALNDRRREPSTT
jgi:hypothetical protein